MRPRLRFSPAQVRAARALLDLSAERIAELAGLEPEAVELYESGHCDLGASELAALAFALYAGGWGVIAIPAADGGEGVRFARPLSSHPVLVSRYATAVPSQAMRRGDGDW